MNQKLAVITLDLEPDHAGRISESYDGWEINRIIGLFSLLRSYAVPLTVFVTGKAIGKHPNILTQMQKSGAEFHLHSYSHNLKHPDAEDEIVRGIEAFHRFFNALPIGYRAPEGRVSYRGLKRLKRHGFLFDSSVFPSVWPHPRYLFFPREPYWTQSGILEIPITAIGPLRMIFALSWIKLFGWNMYRTPINLYGLPDIVVFSFHMHDLYSLPAYSRLSRFWKFIYSRNKDRGVELLNNVLHLLKKRGYTFAPISRLLSQK